MRAHEIGAGQYAMIGQAPSPGEMYLGLKAATTVRPVEEVRAADAALSDRHNPFSVNDGAAVRSGGLVYAAHCATCLGDRADGRGPLAKSYSRAMDFHAAGKRHSVFFAGGVPRDWFSKVNKGYSSPKPNPDGSPRAMPPFGSTLSREQIWLSLMYLQTVVSGKARAPLK